MACVDGMRVCRLESERLTLEPMRPEHADELAPVLNDISLHRFIGGQPDSAAGLRARIQRQAVGHSPDGHARWLNWTVRVRSTGEAVGTMQATVSGSGRHTVAELAWVIGVSQQGRGCAKDAAGLVVSWLRTHGVSCMRAHIHPDHHASMAVARSVGMRPTDAMHDGEVRWESCDGHGRA